MQKTAEPQGTDANMRISCPCPNCKRKGRFMAATYNGKDAVFCVTCRTWFYANGVSLTEIPRPYDKETLAKTGDDE